MTSTPKLWWTQRMRDEFAKTPDLQFHGCFDEDTVEVFEGETMSCWDFCGCGSPGTVIKNMIAYMRSAADKLPDGVKFDEWYKGYKARHPITDQDVFWFCAYLADAAKWTDHGGSVNSAWLLPAGEAWLKDAEAWEIAQKEDKP